MNRKQIREFAELEFIAKAKNIVFVAEAPPLSTIRSLAYFLPVIEEVLELRVSPEYFESPS